MFFTITIERPFTTTFNIGQLIENHLFQYFFKHFQSQTNNLSILKQNQAN